MIGLYRVINDDLYSISRRLKSLDSDYFVLYSYRDHRYEIHNKGNKGNTYCFCAQKLDCRVLDKAQRSRRERIEKLLAEVDEHNERLQKEAIYEVRKSMEMDVENALKKGE